MLKLISKCKKKLIVKHFNRNLSKPTSQYLAVRATAMYMHVNMVVALEENDPTFDRKSLDEVLNSELNELWHCKEKTDRLQKSAEAQHEKGNLTRLDAIKIMFWFSALKDIHDRIVREDIRPQVRIRKQEFGGESKIIDLRTEAVLKR